MTTPTPGGPPRPSETHPVPDLGPKIVVAAFTLWSVAMVFVFLRFYTRIWIVRAIGWADYFVALAAVSWSLPHAVLPLRACQIFGGGLSGSIYRRKSTVPFGPVKKLIKASETLHGMGKHLVDIDIFADVPPLLHVGVTLQVGRRQLTTHIGLVVVLVVLHMHTGLLQNLYLPTLSQHLHI